MKISYLLNQFLVTQAFENNETQLLFGSIEYLFTFICILIAIFIMMFTPLIFTLSMVDNFFELKKYNGKVEVKKCKNNSEEKPSLTQEYCKKFLRVYANFLSNTFGFLCWNMMSFAYILFGFKDVKTGLIEYFYFPFNVFRSLNNENIFNSIDDLNASWMYMLSIVIVSFIFFIIGQLIGNFKGKILVKKIEFKISVNNNLKPVTG